MTNPEGWRGIPPFPPSVSGSSQVGQRTRPSLAAAPPARIRQIPRIQRGTASVPRDAGSTLIRHPRRACAIIPAKSRPSSPGYFRHQPLTTHPCVPPCREHLVSARFPPVGGTHLARDARWHVI